jgi:translation elongation factor EF-1alpha
MGTIVVGKIESGKIKKGQSVLIMPNKVCALSLNELLLMLFVY